MRRPRSLLAPAALTSLVALGAVGCFRPSVLRSFDGELVEGRFIEPAAYEAYARGALAERDGQLEQAATAFAKAAELDEDGPEAWAALARVQCRLGRHDRAEHALERALSADPSSARAREAEAHCAFARADAARALTATEALVRADPLDDEAHLLRARALELAGDPRAALAVLVDLVLRRPERRAASEALLRLAGTLGEAWATRLADELQGGQVVGERAAANELAPQRSARASAASAALERALRRGDRARALALAASARVTLTELALGFARHGHAAQARELATIALDADPSDADAAVALLLSAARTKGDEALAEAARLASSPSLGAPSDAARRALLELVDAWAAEPGAEPR